MPSLSFLLCCLCAFSGTIVSAKQAKEDLTTLPRALELDLVFPRNDTYKPVFPFPIVVAVRGAPAMMDFGLDLELSMGPDIPGLLTSAGGLTDVPIALLTKKDTYYLISANTRLINSTSPHWRLDWMFILNPNCTAALNSTAPDSPPASINYTDIRGSLHFTVSSEGKLPDIVPSDDSCPLPIVAYNVTGHETYNPSYN